jgi:hypothetical protein
VLEHWALCYQNSQTYEELEDKRLSNEAIDETGSVPCANIGSDEMGCVNIENIEQQHLTEIRGVSDHLLEVHRVPQGRRGEGITRLIYENLNGLQSTLLSKNKKLEKVQQVINNLQADVVCYNERQQNLWHKSNRNGF